MLYINIAHNVIFNMRKLCWLIDSADEGDGLDWHTCYKIIRGTCEGLSYLHNNPSGSVLHLGLKPENILLTGSMVPKIGDFGMSTIFGYGSTKFFREFLGAAYR